jgi:catechol 2,3-dioxygenase-like lactoylglutathione lyase family enzyme
MIENRSARIEHINITVRDNQKTAALLVDLFGWHIRWQGPAMLGGHSIHVGSENSYIALYMGNNSKPTTAFAKGQPLNHLGIEVGDLDAIEAKVIAAGLEPHSHGDYEPGRRFYFFDNDGIEFEVISYQ